MKLRVIRNYNKMQKRIKESPHLTNKFEARDIINIIKDHVEVFDIEE